MVEGKEVHMSEPTNAPRVWLRWALASALVCGTVIGTIAPAFGQEDPAATESADGQPAEQAQPAADAPACEESQFEEAVGAALTAKTTAAPVEEAPPADAPPAEEQQTDEPVTAAPLAEQ